ncbi:hypothetical protein JKA74_20585 [Marivirga sp. S37H4]|uniref:Lipocalin-like domain-containing protein n=1 Tax=Marivirga aurantiaca TaxID=2802615 RepID=A0A935CBZ9_9BACT|nr:hypothetical protein [Marivirga aurantiaca]MBK6267445.1 hypothetical protein [Marivirga aurantiaca]
MRKFINYIFVLGIALIAISCAKPEDPSTGKMVVGEWLVDEAYVSGQADDSDIIERLVIERDGNFVLEDANGVLSVGTWSATETALTLTGTGEGSETRDLQIVTMTYSKAHFVQNVSSSIAGDFEIRYLMNRFSGNNY